jgi:hypothetical protein
MSTPEQEIDDGGTAFPTPGKAFEFTGLTIRDWFAGQALQAVIQEFKCIDYDEAEVSQGAYAIADAMLKERSK